MALPSSETGFVSVSATTSKRNLQRELVGNFFFDIVSDGSRHKGFLQRNMARSLAYHEKSRLQRSRKPVLENRQSPHLVGNSTASGSNSDTLKDVTHSLESKQRIPQVNHNVDDAVDDQSRTQTKRKVPSRKSQNDESDLMTQNTSKNALSGAFKNEQHDPNHRRSRRIRDERPHQEPDAHLYLDFRNIRKKLNFKENGQRLEGHPQKRVKLDHIRCHAHLCIWDNSPGVKQQDPIIRKTEACDILKSSRADTRDANLMVGVKLDYPFIISSKDFKVPVQRKGVMDLDFAENYFMEIKIVPTSETEAWPPIPLLGKSEGDQLNGLGEVAAEHLQSSLVMRYQKLPEAPDADYAISVFYLHEGITFKTKFALQVDAKWSKPEALPIILRPDPQEHLESWVVDKDDRPFGRSPVKASPPRKQQEAPRDLPVTTAPVAAKSVSPAKPLKRIPLPVNITYKVDPAKANTAPKQFRNVTVVGFKCPACSTHRSEGLEQLIFHLSNMHHKYKFIVEQTQDQENSNWLAAAIIRVETPETKPRFTARNDKFLDDDWSWLAPVDPFDLHKHAEGDLSWSGGRNHIKQKRQTGGVHITPVVQADHVSEIRKEHGFLPSEYVPEFRPAQHQRKRHKPVPLQIKYKGERIPYTSISHRQIDLAGDDELSESDDETNEDWFINKYVESSDLSFSNADISEQAIILNKAWDLHLLEERLPHSRYLSDSLIRFVKRYRRWLQGSDLRTVATNSHYRNEPEPENDLNTERDDKLTERNLALYELLLELLEKRTVNESVLTDVQRIIHGSSGISVTEKHTDGRNSLDLEDIKAGEESCIDHPGQGNATKPPRPSFWTCKMCEKPILQHGIRDVRCSNLECSTPAQFYHFKCTGLARLEQRREWKCNECAMLEDGQKAKQPDAQAADPPIEWSEK